MSKAAKLLVALLAVLVTMQFLQPDKNRSNTAHTADLVVHIHTPSNVERILKTSCYDCHSNNTHYPWYSNIQPIGWILARHIKQGKKELNFNEFQTYSKRRQVSKLKSVQNTIKDGSMPLNSYTLLHNDAKLSESDKALILNWAGTVIDSLLQQ